MDTGLAGSLLKRSGEEAVKARLREETETALGRYETGQDRTGQAVPTPGLHQCLVAIRLILPTVVEVLFFFNVRALGTIIVPYYNI